MLVKFLDWAAELAHSIAKRIPVIGKHFTDEIIRFLIIGSSAFAINFIVYQSLLALLDYFVETDSEVLRAVIVGGPFLIAYVVAYIFNFYMSKKWTFKNSSPKTGSQAFKFLLVNTFNALSGSVVIAVLENFGLTPLLAHPLFVATEAIWSFLLYKFWVFKERDIEELPNPIG